MPGTTIHLRRIPRPTKGGRVRYEWHLRWHETTGKHRCEKIGDCSTMTKREAEAKRRAFQAKMERDEVPRDRPRRMTLAEFAEYHAAMMGQDRKPTTLYEYRLAARLAAEILGPNKPIQETTPSDASKVRNRLSGKPATRAKHIARLRAMFNHAKRWGLIHGQNPFANQPMPRFTARSMRIFSGEEIEAMLEAASTDWWRAFILVGVTAGLRREEILNLQWTDLNEDGRELSVTAKRAEPFKGPDGRDYATLAWEPKTYEPRTIPIPDRTIEALKVLREQPDGSPYVFVSLERLRVINAKAGAGERRARSETCNNILRDFRVIQKHAAQRLKQKKWVFGSVHDLRRTYGTRMADVVPIHVLRQWMGHSDVSVTARFYLGQSDGHAERARDAALPADQSGPLYAKR